MAKTNHFLGKPSFRVIDAERKFAICVKGKRKDEFVRELEVVNGECDQVSIYKEGGFTRGYLSWEVAAAEENNHYFNF